MANSRVLKYLAWLVLVSLVVGAPKVSRAAVTCEQVVTNLYPCINYVLRGGQVPGQCCTGIKNLFSAAQNTPDRRTVCKCMKSAISSSGVAYNSYNIGLAAGLPAKCHVNVPYKIDPSTNCDTIQ
ncbi:non-specific lipid-transfer protein P5 [Manihot esculenta]|uniref:Non-specific lipid-transfer protein n=1 Tax=Manihot esculenta TaxID=3983 RepID=A0A2C9VH42_MANES|nr:non-specific lipid-transfer protein P5 [Manihot esculenta]OAY44687.1 hypothetical protein MANES_08G171700v8 [Manihot esculenta]